MLTLLNINSRHLCNQTKSHLLCLRPKQVRNEDRYLYKREYVNEGASGRAEGGSCSVSGVGGWVNSHDRATHVNPYSFCNWKEGWDCKKQWSASAVVLAMTTCSSLWLPEKKFPALAVMVYRNFQNTWMKLAEHGSKSCCNVQIRSFWWSQRLPRRVFV